MKRKKINTAIFAVLTAALLLVTLCGCGGNRTAGEPGHAAGVEPVRPAGTAGTSTDESGPGRQDGERFETVIMLEGMEETIQYEHVRNETAGYEMDFDFEMIERRSGSDSERFVSRYDDPEDPWNYLELTFNAENADAVAAAVCETLSEDFDTVVREPFMLELAGGCERIDASGARNQKTPPGSLQTVYVIPASDGCLVAAAHCTVESAEGFGRRFTAMLNTLSVIGRRPGA